jgi:SOS-response transcriptional repressor LexA
MLERGAKEVSSDSSIGLLFRVLEDGAPVLSAVGEWQEGAVASFAKRVAEVKGGNTECPGAAIGCRSIPVLGWAHAGQAEDYDQLPEDWQDLIPTECRDPKAFAVRLEGESMMPRFEEGDLLILMPEAEVYNGVLAVVRLASGGVVFRRIEIREERLVLVPLNPQYQREEFNTSQVSWIYPLWGIWRQIWK